MTMTVRSIPVMGDLLPMPDLLPSPGWYPNPTGARGLWYWDGAQWTAPRRSRRWWWIGGSVGAVLILALGIFALIWVHLELQPVHDAHSSDAQREAFYRELDATGFGRMRVMDAEDWGKDACHGNGLVIWGRDGYSMADSFRFATAALKACATLK